MAFGSLIGLFALPHVWDLTSRLVVEAMLRTGRASVGAFGTVRGSEAVYTVGRVLVFLVAVSALFTLVWTLVGAPAVALAHRTVRSDDPGGWGGLATTGIAGRYPTLLSAGILRGVVAAGLAVVVAPALLGVYFGVGTPLEVLGYALGLYELLPPKVPALAALLVVVFTWIAVTAALGFTSVAASASGGDPAGAVRDSLRYAVSAPRQALAHGVVVAQAILAPFFLGLAAFAVAAASVGSTAALPARLVGVGTFLLAGTVGFALAAVYRARAFDRDVRPVLAGSPEIRSRLSTARTALVAVLLVAALVGGGAVRVDDARPGWEPPKPPGAVDTDAPPSAVIQAGMNASLDTEYRVTIHRYRREVNLSNGSKGPWENFLNARYALDVSDRQAQVVGSVTTDGGARISSMYVARTYHTVGTRDVPNHTVALDALRGGDWRASRPRLPDVRHGPTKLAFELGGHLYGYEPVVGNWSLVEVGDGTAVYRSRDPKAVAGVRTRGVENMDRFVRVRATVTVDTKSGYIRRIETRTLMKVQDEKRWVELRHVQVVDQYGSVDVARPDGVNPPPIAVVLDALFY